MKDSARYAKIVEWSEEDQCFLGRAPGLVDSGCHGTDEKTVFDELCQIVEETIALYREDGKPLPPPASGTASFTHYEVAEIRDRKKAVVGSRGFHSTPR